MTPAKINRDDLHKLLWVRSQEHDPKGELRVVQKDLAEQFRVHKQRISDTMKAMEREGRVKRLSWMRQPASVTYAVADPLGERFGPSV